MPTLINKIQDRQNVAKWKREFSLISNAFQSVLNEDVQICRAYDSNGNCMSEPSGVFLPSDEFIKSIEQKLKVIDYCTDVAGKKACDNYSHFDQKNIKYKWTGVGGIDSRYKALGGTTGIKAYNFSYYVYLLNDGAAVHFGGSHGGFWVVVDVNNFTHGPNEFGRDVFVAKISSNIKNNRHIMKPMGAEGTFNKSVNGDVCECSKDKGVKTANYIAGQGGQGEVISGACCSAYYLYSK